LGAARIPDCTTAGDFCRRFAPEDVEALATAINETRLKVWAQQPPRFFEEAVIEGDGTIVETGAEKKGGIDLSYDGRWGYHPLLISLANTQEPLFVVNRSAHDHQLPDAYLVRRAQHGEPAAFALLVTRYQDRVFRTCYRMCHNHADAADLTQITFLKALEGLKTFESRANFYTWLFRIATNAVISERRRRQRHGVLPLDEDDAGERGRATRSPREPDAADVVDRQEQSERVAAALAQVDEEFRAALVLKEIEELDYATIAEILSIPLGTVKSRIHRGRLMLRELLRFGANAR
jgi:RNA polymerase sigma-70 factor (ECF subfamily)